MSKAGPIRVVIAEDMKPIREHFETILNYEKDIEVIECVETGKQAVNSVCMYKPDILLTDIQMESECDGIDAIATIVKSGLSAKCIVLTIHNEDELIFNAFEAGAIDYILKDASTVDIINAIRMVRSDNISIRPEIAGRLRNEFARMRREQSNLICTLNTIYCLTQSELEILKLLIKGYKQKDISRIRCVEPTTTRTHISNILKKFDKDSVKAVVKMLKELKAIELFDK